MPNEEDQTYSGSPFQRIYMEERKFLPYSYTLVDVMNKLEEIQKEIQIVSEKVNNGNDGHVLINGIWRK